MCPKVLAHATAAETWSNISRYKQSICCKTYGEGSKPHVLAPIKILSMHLFSFPTQLCAFTSFRNVCGQYTKCWCLSGYPSKLLAPQKDRRPAWKKSSCDCVLSAPRLVPKEIKGKELSLPSLPSPITNWVSTSLRWSELVKGQKPARSSLWWLSVLQRQKTSGLRSKLSLVTKRLRVSLRLRAETKGGKSPRLNPWNMLSVLVKA